MESGDSGVTSPVLRVTAEITELKEKHERSGNHNYSISPSLMSKECKNHSVCLKKKYLKPLYGYNPYERSNYGGSCISSQQNPKNNVSSFTQRVMSAKLLRMKQLQNQLYETQAKLNEVLQENRTLKTVQQRQDCVLKKYEGNQEQLPQLMRSHHEEIRVLNEKYKQLRNNHRDLENKLKQKDNELTILREQHKHLLKLSKDKQLGERVKLAKKIEEMQVTIDEQRKKIFMLSKKLDLEEKSFNHQLSLEVAKQRKIHGELNSALETINNLKGSLEAKERLSAVSFRRPPQNSAKNPLRVSFRQPQQPAQFNNAAENDEAETTDDSFIMNYSPAAHSSSLESDTSTSSKEQKGPENRTQTGKSSYVSILNASLKNGIKTPKNSSAAAIHEAAKNNPTVIKEELIQKPEESKVRRKLQAQKTFQRDLTANQTSRQSSLKKLENNYSETSTKEVESQNEQLGHTNATFQTENKNETENQAPSSSGEKTEIKADNLILTSTTEKIDNDMKLDLDSEFEKYFQSTELSDEAISEFYKRDFKEEIYEIERKFQELNEQNSEKIENMKAANRLTHVVSSSDHSESEESPTPTAQQREETTNETSNISDNHSVKETKPAFPVLGESQKANLLKALNNIDKDAIRNDVLDDKIELPQISTSPVLMSEMSYLDKVNELKKSYSRTRRKSEVLKDLFGGDAAVLNS